MKEMFEATEPAETVLSFSGSREMTVGRPLVSVGKDVLLDGGKTYTGSDATELEGRGEEELVGLGKSGLFESITARDDVKTPVGNISVLPKGKVEYTCFWTISVTVPVVTVGCAS